MKNKIFIVYFFSIFFILINVLSGLCEETSVPEIFIEEHVFNAGEIKKADSLEHTFKIYNKGAGILEISEVRTD